MCRRRLLLPALLLTAAVLSTTASASPAATAWSGTVIGFGGPVVGNGNDSLVTAVSSTGKLTELSLPSQPQIGDRLNIEGNENGSVFVANSVHIVGSVTIVLIHRVRINVLRKGVYQFVSTGGPNPTYWPVEVSFTAAQAAWVLSASDQHARATIALQIRGDQLYHLAPRPTAARGPQSQALRSQVSRDASAYLDALTSGRFADACQLTSNDALARYGGYKSCLSLFQSFGTLYSKSKLEITGITLSGAANQTAFIDISRYARDSSAKAVQTTAMFVLERGRYRFDREIG